MSDFQENASHSASKRTEKQQKELDSEISKAVVPYVENYTKRILESHKRISNILKLHNSLLERITLEGETDEISRAVLDDLLRLCVVFIHAMLEDFLRTFASKLLPHAGEEALKNIPLIGESSPSKLHLGKLSNFRGQSIDEVISSSVHKHLEYSNYNNINDIVNLFKSLKVDIEKGKPHFAKLSELMLRRHQIVHRVDNPQPIGSENISVEHLHFQQVIDWSDSVNSFVCATLPALVTKELIEDGDFS